jgi:parvulin-like peptidyl-prolyl isomerase
LLIIIGGIIRFIAIVCQRYNSLLIGQKAKQKGIVVTDQEIDGRINVIAQRQKMSLQDYRDMLKAKGEDFSQFRDKVRQNLQG